eukprot:TRINITY_DN68714_c0_g1_i1.p1 TRINITY_DN68714_c0_g1~~TRINITY_DN68714_c0_g1_i1.p1  ORF type:complete len:176 (+),score=12.22 TRINITY_DN68714_c0_g1_i1:247-774(+)
MELSGLLGSDLLLPQQGCTLDLTNETLSWPTVTTPLPSCLLEAKAGIPVAHINCTGGKFHFAVDTGAVRTYLSPQLAQGLPRIGTVQDFYPGMGKFSADEVTMFATIGDSQLSIRAGVLPTDLAALTQALGLDGILGLDVLVVTPFHFDVQGCRMAPVVALSAERQPVVENVALD